MACERKSNNRYAIMSSISVVVFLSLVFTLTPFSQKFTQLASPYLYLSAENYGVLTPQIEQALGLVNGIPISWISYYYYENPLEKILPDVFNLNGKTLQ